MPVESAADRAVFANPDEFGAVVTWFAQGVQLEPFSAVFDSTAFIQETGEGGDALNRRATLKFAESLLPAGAGERTDECIVGGARYNVKAVLPDGTGMVTVYLELIFIITSMDFTNPTNAQLLAILADEEDL